MRRFLLLTPLALLALAPFAPLACSSSSSSSGGDDGGADGGSITYTPQGCAYTVTQPSSRGSLAQALDDGAKIDDVAGAAPARVRIGLGGGVKAGAAGYADPSTTAVFTWETVAPVNAAQVRLGTSAGALGDVHKGYSFTLPPPETGPGASEDPTRLHEVHVCGLKAGTTYYYQVGGGAPGAEAWSATQSFTTVPASGPVTVGVSGDSRDSADVFQMVQLRMRDAAVAMQLFSGDLIFIGPEESLYKQWLDKAWKDPQDANKFLTLGQQMIVSVAGNHENDSAQYFANFALPGDGDNAETYASFNVANTHFVVLDDEQIAIAPTGDVAKEQLAWLDADLTQADADRAAHPFVVAMHHRGEYSTSTHGTDADVGKMRDALLPLWDKHHVDLVLNGHDHNYERSKPVSGPYASPTVGTGTTYVVCAGAGASGYKPGADPAAYREKNVAFGSGTPYVGTYLLLTLDTGKITVKAYGLKSAGGTVAGDDVIDTFDLTH